MGVTARAALEAGGEVLGIIPQRLLDREVGKRDMTELRVTATMFERKELLIAEVGRVRGAAGRARHARRDPGRRHPAPARLSRQADTAGRSGGFWRRCDALVEQFVAAGFAAPDVARLYELVAELPDLMARLEATAIGRKTSGQ